MGRGRGVEWRLQTLIDLKGKDEAFLRQAERASSLVGAVFQEDCRCHCRQGSRDRERSGFLSPEALREDMPSSFFQPYPVGWTALRRRHRHLPGLGPELEMGKYLLCLSWRRWIFNQEAA